MKYMPASKATMARFFLNFIKRKRISVEAYFDKSSYSDCDPQSMYSTLLYRTFLWYVLRVRNLFREASMK